jgi:plastocyanin
MRRVGFRRLAVSAALPVPLLMAIGAVWLQPALTARAASTTYVCGYDDSSTYNGSVTDHCAASGTHCSTAQPRCWVQADVSVFTGDLVDWGTGTGTHSVAVYDTPGQPAWPCQPSGTSGSCTFTRPGIYHFKCYYHGSSGMVGSVTVTQAPAPSPTPAQSTSPATSPAAQPTPQPTRSGGQTGGSASPQPGASPAIPATAGSPAAVASPAPGASPGDVALATSPSPAQLSILSGGGTPPAAGAHPAAATEPFGIAHFWLLAVAAVLLVGIFLVGLGVLRLVRPGASETAED